MAGVLVLIALIVGAVIAIGLAGQVAHQIMCTIDRVFGFDACQAGPAYPVAETTRTVGYNARVGFADGQHQYVVTLTKLSNGTAQVNIADVKQVGASLQVGAHVSAGPLFDASAGASLGGGGLVGDSSTFSASSWSAGQGDFRKISGGSGLSLAVHDTTSGLFGGTIGGLLDNIDGGQGAPGEGSLPHKQLSSHSIGLGVYASGSADAGAHVEGVGGADAGVSANAQVDASRIDYGSQKGDRQYQISLGGQGSASLGESLFGGRQADGAGSVQGSAVVTVSPSGQPLALVVDAQGQGVWDIGPATDQHAEIPGSEGPGGSGTGEPGSEGAGKSSALSHEEPVLEVSSSDSGGTGVGSDFQATLNLANDPAAASDVNDLLHLDLSSIPAVVSAVNRYGSEQLETFHVKQSNSSYSLEGNAGVGLGGGVQDGSGTECVDSITVRPPSGGWNPVPFNRAPGC